MKLGSATRSVLLTLLSFVALASAAHAQTYEVYCQDGIDNDGDNRIDTNPAGTPPGNLGPDSDCQCFDDTVPGTLQCTANDLSFVVVGLGTQTDGCVNASDTVDILFGATLETTGNNRYDIGMWVALDGGNARTGKCARQILVPPITPVSTTPTAAQLNSGNGPFRSEDTGDLCADLDKSDDPDGSNSFNARYNFKDLNTGPTYSVQPEYQLSCGSATNGVLNISTCVGYEQNAGGVCNTLDAAVPGTGSKCRCQGPPNFSSNVPVPNLALSCGCTLNANGTVSCDVTYSNNGQGTCNPVSSATDSEFGCGVARYLRFKTTYPLADGSITTGPSTCTPATSGTTTANCNTGPGRGTATDDAAGTLTWTPRSDNGAGSGTIGWVGVNESERLRFTFTQTSSGPAVLSFPTVAEWANNSAFTGAVQQTALTCSTNLTTPVTLSGFEAREEGGRIVVDWQTETEAGNAGFNLYAETTAGKVKLNERPIPSARVDSLEPQRYEAEFAAEGLENARFYLEEVSVSGIGRQHGPFAVGARVGGGKHEKPTDWAAIRSEHEFRQTQRERNERRASANRRTPTGQAPTGEIGASSYPAVDIKVTANGIQRVTFEALAAVGANYSGAKPADLVLENRGTQVPIIVGGAKTFGAGSYIEFVGKPLDTLYTGTNVYRLSLGRRGLRAAVDSTVPKGSVTAAPFYMETVSVERNLQYSFGSQIADPWYDTYLQSFGAPTSKNFVAVIDHLAPSAVPSRLKVETWGVTGWPQDPDHHLVTRFNGAQVADDVFDGPVENTFEIDLAPGTVVEGNNTLTLAQVPDLGVAYDFVAFEGFSIRYPRTFVAKSDRLSFSATGGRFAIDGFTQPNLVVYRENAAGGLTLLSGAVVTGGPGAYSVSAPGSSSADTYHVATTAALAAPALEIARDPSSLGSGAAELLIVSHPDFIDALAPLVNARLNEGYSVKVVDVRDVYARDSHGNFDPEAIRRYVSFAYTNLGTRYVVLVGGDTYDYRGYTSTGAIGFLPSLYAETGSYVTFAPVDPLFGDVDGNGVPDIPVGRFPVRTVSQLDAMIDKTLAYGAKSYGETAVLVADKYDTASATSFSVMSDEFAGPLVDDWSLTKAYVDLDGQALAKSKLIGAINNGVALTTFIGHSGPTRWTLTGLFNSSNAAELTNVGLPTVVAQLGCWSAYYVAPTYDGMAHRFLLSGDRGAAAVMGAVALTETESDRAFGALLMTPLVEPGVTIGDAVQAARSGLAASHPEMLDVLLGFTILGDPTLIVEP